MQVLRREKQAPAVQAVKWTIELDADSEPVHRLSDGHPSCHRPQTATQISQVFFKTCKFLRSTFMCVVRPTSTCGPCGPARLTSLLLCPFRPSLYRALPSLVRVMTPAQGLRQTLSGCEHAERGRFGISRKRRQEQLGLDKRCDSLCTSDRSENFGAVVNDQSSHLVAGSLRSFPLDSWSSTALSGRDIDKGIRDRVVFNLSFFF